MTLQSHPEMADRAAQSPVWCLVCGAAGMRDVLLNLLLFVPIGLGLGLRGWAPGRATLAGFVVSLLIELVQFGALVGRDPSLSDLVTNTLGTLAGAALAGRWRAILAPTPVHARGAGLAGALCWIGVLYLGGWLQHTALPQTRWYGQWQAELGHLDLFRGSVLDVRLNGTRLPGHELGNSAAVRSVLATEDFELRVRAVAGTAPERLAPIFSIFDEHNTAILILGQTGTSVAFGIRTNASRVLVEQPPVILRGALDVQAGDTVMITGGMAQGHYVLGVRHRAGVIERRIPISPAWSWMHVFPWEYVIDSTAPALSALWLGALILPVGYLLASGFSVAWGLVLTLALAALGLGTAPGVTALPSIEWQVWLGAGVGALAGALAALLRR